MSTMQVWHEREPSWGHGPKKQFNEENFELVAKVEGESLGDAFQLTNHIDHGWHDNKEVTLLADSERRSTSVGDVVVLDGNAHRCERAGWSDVEQE